MSLRGDMIKRARARVDARARDRARDEARAEYGRNLSKRKFEPKRSVGNLGDKIIETVRGVSGDAKRKVSNITDATGEGIMGVYDAGAKFMQSLMSNIDRSAQNREILGDAYTDDLRKSMMTDDDLDFYNKYVGLANLASDNQERDRLMDIANTAMQNAQITKRINYALGQPEFGFETTAPAGVANIDYSTLVDRMVGGTDDSVGLEGSAVGKEFLKRAYEAQAGESGDNMISDSIKNKYDIADFFPMSRDLAPQFTTADIPYTQRFPNIFSDPEISKRLDEVGFFERDMVSPKEPNTFVGGNKMLENYAIEDDGIVRGLQKSDVDEFDPYLSPSFPFYDDNRQKYMNYLLQSGAYD